MKIHNYHPITGEYLNSTDADIDPMETIKAGEDIYLIPANATSQVLPNIAADHVACFVDGAWEIRRDLRGTRYWDATGEHVVKTLDSLHQEATLIPPPTHYHTLIEGAWQVTTEGLDRAKIEQEVQINQDCEVASISGFESMALGVSHRYQSDHDDQTNLLGLVAADADLPLKCLAADATDWSYLLHTAAQLKQVLRDGANHKLQLLQRCNDIKIRIKNAQTLDAILAEVWAEE